MKPGEFSVPQPIYTEIEAVRFRNAYGQVVAATPSLNGRILDVTITGAPAADKADLDAWRKPVNQLVARNWGRREFLDDADIAKIAGICISIDATFDDWQEWAEGPAENPEEGKLRHDNNRIPTKYRPIVLVKLTEDDFQRYRLVVANAEQGVAAVAPAGRGQSSKPKSALEAWLQKS